MINADQIQRAERMLQVVYQERAVPRQLASMEVEMIDFNNFLSELVATAEKRVGITWQTADARIHQAYNTLLMHFFLCGLICGRNEALGE